MKEEDLHVLISKKKYNFFIFSSPAFFPFRFAKHTRVVTSNQGDVHRREVAHFKNKKNPSMGHLHKDLFKPRQGIWKYFRNKEKCYESELLYHISGDTHSGAEDLVKSIEGSLEKTYQRKHRYHLFPGPNSNTFTQWVIDHNPEIHFQLPANAVGKDYK